MMKSKLTETLREAVFAHDNDYGFDVDTVLRTQVTKLPTLSVVIPHYDSNLIQEVLKALYVGLNEVKNIDPAWRYEVIIVDDGSRCTAETRVGSMSYENLIHVTLRVNTGRTNVRNLGLKTARMELVLFVDADIIVRPTIIADHLKVHAYTGEPSRLITAGFFTTVFSSSDDVRQITITELMSNHELNDFRLGCFYEQSWIGCEEDKQFVGMRFNAVGETDSFRKWPRGGYFGPWILPNMILGGFFIVNRKEALAVGGFDQSFEGYGFTETSLPTKLIAVRDHYVVPVVGAGCLHVDVVDVIQSRTEKDKRFRLRHRHYFTDYLERTCGEVVNE